VIVEHSYPPPGPGRRLCRQAGTRSAAAARAPAPRCRAAGDLVQVDCFYIGRLSGTRGRTWQYTAIDVAGSFVWGSVQVSEVNPDTKHCSALVRRVADDLAAAGWKLKAVSTDNGGEFRAESFARSVTALGAKQRFIRAGRPQTNGAVERVHRTILEECWRPSFARALVPRYTALKRDLDAYLNYYNYERAHTGRRNLGRIPAELVYGARKMRPR
jgi:transposase InsO family protein